MMKKTLLIEMAVVLFLSFGIINSAKATPVDSSVIVRGDFNLIEQTIPPPYDSFTPVVEFDNYIDALDLGEGFRLSLVDSSNNRLYPSRSVYSSHPSSSERFSAVGFDEDFGSNKYTPITGDHIILDNIVGSFELRDIILNFYNSDVGGGNPTSVYCNITTSPTPEPSTMLLLGSGILGVAGIGRKRFKKK